MNSSRLTKFLIPVFAVLLGVIAGSIVMLVSGYNPIAGYSALLYGSFGDSYYIGETIRQTTPYILAGLAVAFAFRTGLFNIGVEGQLIVGWLASVWVGVSLDLPKVIHLPLAILAAAAAGALWAFIPGFLKARFKVHEVIITIMMNYIALHVTNAIIRSVLSDKGFKSETVHPSASLQSEFLQSITDYSTLHYGIIISLIGAIIMWFLLEKTAKGYELRAVGFNQHASQYAGMNVPRNIILSMVISGAFAGVAGAMEGLGTFGNISVKAGFTGIGFDGIAVALIGSNNAFGIILSALLFGALKVGALEMPSSADVPTELVDIVIALIIFFVASSYLIRLLLSRFKKEGK
ncbi:branched-chain amino acid transport system / permease component family protein [Anoxybacillus sp. B7M1]|jgi:general nucleoside transport system permease protein|uniref:ABC transporter permease n=1 Tax=Anoxybacteroides rupiense TaxID=311460 RepID=A0ABD5IQI5_9BACL|nr:MULTISPECIES: ABC transporter permease [Anoxybacillus]ANB58008.1 branched-chain amino acid transport system / permease component family protein [Anoxybacillus sp. B2M1]ANB63797.1 branched-chain amino acid transport system / permease component family protein [Anoxybacillus sp. B7M1]KXG10613.1 D-allose transport system permease protein AlsC [Anoxybacillus sp. P3H1B]MBB3906103.1 simple sugar transport system permease protein [Anoxybacillus rupiensis]MBS2771072.1 ABC transporter permease [Anoxy